MHLSSVRISILCVIDRSQDLPEHLLFLFVHLLSSPGLVLINTLGHILRIFGNTVFFHSKSVIRHNDAEWPHGKDIANSGNDCKPNKLPTSQVPLGNDDHVDPMVENWSYDDCAAVLSRYHVPIIKNGSIIITGMRDKSNGFWNIPLAPKLSPCKLLLHVIAEPTPRQSLQSLFPPVATSFMSLPHPAPSTHPLLNPILPLSSMQPFLVLLYRH